MDDDRLLIGLRSGDRQAYVEVAERFSREIWAYIYGMCGDRELASDVCQETAVKTWQAAPRFEGIKALRSWIYRVARNTYIDHLRRLHHTTSALDGSQPDARVCAQEDTAKTVADRQLLHNALAQLPEKVREAVILTKVQGMNCAEAAEVLDAPVGTVKWWISDGLKSLRRILSEDDLV